MPTIDRDAGQGSGRRASDRRKEAQPYDGPDRRKGDRRSGQDRRKAERRAPHDTQVFPDTDKGPADE